MPRRPRETPEEHLYGAQEAADFLGVHRSTLHLAVKRMLLTPDAFTPGGHMRFRRETLATYAQHLIHHPATSSAHILSELARTLALPDGAEAMCRLAFASIHQAVPALTMFAVGLRSPTPADPHALAPIIQEGFVHRVHDIYAQLRPNVEFAATVVLRTREPEICEDTAATPALRLGTERIVRLEGMGAYAVLPLMQGDEILGVLIAASRRQHRFPTGEVSFLRSVASDLAVALACHDLVDRKRAGLLAAAELARTALVLRANLQRTPGSARADANGHNRSGAAVGELVSLFVSQGGATLVGFLGPRAREAVLAGGDEADPRRAGRLRALLALARAAPAVRHERWSDETGTHSATALGLPWANGHALAVGASWHGERADQEADEALVATLGGAYALLLDADATCAGVTCAGVTCAGDVR